MRHLSVGAALFCASVCAVERGWMSQYDFPQFWNPHMRGPLCYNPPAVRSILPYTIKRTELVLSGRSKSAMIAGIKDAITKNFIHHSVVSRTAGDVVLQRATSATQSVRYHG